jgi:TatD DNase family protein
MISENKIFDSHAHYDDERFDEDRLSAIENQFQNGVEYIINCSCTIDASRKNLELAKDFKNLYVAAGIHPHDAESANLDTLYDDLKELSKAEKMVAIGEIGLDFHYDFCERNHQQKVFIKQLEIANKLDLPVIIHDREAHELMYKILREYKPKGVIHCFSGSVELMKETVKLGMYVGLGGAVTFKNARVPVDVAREVPIDRLLLETDAPYMAPVPFRGKRCNSLMIDVTAEKIADIRGISKAELISVTNENAKRLFGIK